MSSRVSTFCAVVRCIIFALTASFPREHRHHSLDQISNTSARNKRSKPFLIATIIIRKKVTKKLGVSLWFVRLLFVNEENRHREAARDPSKVTFWI